MNSDLKFPFHALELLEKLNNNGFEAYIVGGAVRNALLGLPYEDIDVTTSAKIDDIKRVFSDCKIIETGVKHGTLTVVNNGKNYEITTFRNDGDYQDHRHPDNVSFVSSLNEDLSRRDFTVNALAYSFDGRLIDLFDGVSDLENGLIKAVGDASKRFDEDALRILRAVRFCSEYGFEVEHETYLAMKKKVGNLRFLSVERVFLETTKILLGKYASRVLKKYSFVIFNVFPELQPEYKCLHLNLSHKFDVFEHTLCALDNLEVRDEQLVWATLFHDAGKPFTIKFGDDGYRHFPGHWTISEKIVKGVLTRMKAPKKFAENVCTLVLYHDYNFESGKGEIKRFLSKYGETLFEKLLVIKRADLMAHSKHGINKYGHFYYTLKDLFTEIRDNNECYKLSDLAVNGEYLIKKGYSGKAVGSTLDKILDLVIDGKLQNDVRSIDFYLENIKNDR